MSNPSRWLHHTANTEPAGFRAEIERLPNDVRSLSEVVQGLLIHTDCLPLYGIDPASLGPVSRTTLPVSERLSRFADPDRVGLGEARPPGRREVGTCRDFALLLCSFLRTRGIPARVRCGFASYLGDGWWDHWICEHWSRDVGGWLQADAQLDRVMRDACAICFDSMSLPRGAFLTAGEAWAECRAERLPFADFGHGEQRGMWFIGVNVVRDSLSLNGWEVSAWDGWREAPHSARSVSADDPLRLDDLARDPARSIRPGWPRREALTEAPSRAAGLRRTLRPAMILSLAKRCGRDLGPATDPGRRRSNRPGNSQAEGPRRESTLERGTPRRARRRGSCPTKSGGQSLRYP